MVCAFVVQWEQNSNFKQQFLQFTVHYLDHLCRVASLHSLFAKTGPKFEQRQYMGESAQMCRLAWSFAASLNGTEPPQ